MRPFMHTPRKRMTTLDYITPEEFESAIKNEDFRKKSIEKKNGKCKHVELLE